MSSDVSTEKICFQCNREVPTCAGCGSTVRRRALMRMLSREIFGMNMRNSDFSFSKDFRGLGMSDSMDHAKKLTEKFDYRNTYYDREPNFDITQVGNHELGSYDFIISSEVLEHVVAP